MTEVLFYHLQNAPLERVLPQLLGRSLERGWKAVVKVGGAERLDAINNSLWTFSDESFLPHGIDFGTDDGMAERQPVLLTLSDEPANKASVRFAVDGSDVPSLEGCERLVLMFDGHDQAQVERAREQWKDLKAGDHTLTYWQQTSDRRWEHKA